MNTHILQSNVVDYQQAVIEKPNQKYALKLAIAGMNCAGCGFKIEKALRAYEGVEAYVNVTEKRLDLIWQGNAARGQAFIEVVTKLGFQVALVKEKDREADESVKKLLWYMAISGFASGNLMIFSLRNNGRDNA
jgi:cation transport ATPase